MTAAEFKKKWSRYSGKETSAYQSHFDDLCRLLGEQTPNEADPSGADFFCFQKRVVKDAELFEMDAPDASEPTERGFADVWKRGCFAWEYKGKKKNLDEAYKQLQRYRESLLNPPLLVVCDFDRYIIRTNFNGTVQEVHEFTNAEIDRPENLRILRALFSEPEFLKPQRTTAEVTKALAVQIAEIAKSQQSRESVELADAKSRKEVNVAQKKNLRIARFLNRIVFCFFAEDTGLLPKNLFTEIAKTGIDDPKHFAESLEKLFAVMATGGTFGKDKIRYFNGHLFEESSVFELTEAELRQLADAGEADWQFIEPSIMGTLFERALEPEQRSQLGAHYTSEADIKTLVEPVLMQPFRREWAEIKSELVGDDVRSLKSNGKKLASPYVVSYKEKKEKLAAFQNKLSAVTVLDPACGSGNFLYVSLQLLLSLEKEVIAYATQLGFAFKPQVNVQQLRALEINPYAFELAQVSVQIGFLQWRRDNGFDNDRTPVLQNLDGFQNEDALLVPHFRNKAKTLKEAQAGEHAGDDALKFYTEREWPACDVIVGNPPFLGDKLMRGELGDDYVEELRKIYGNRIPGQSDLCCYWFEKAREQIEKKKCERAGLLATQGIRGGANREVLKRIKETGDIFFAESDCAWILAGANVHVSMIGFDNGSETLRFLDSKSASEINAQLVESKSTSDVEILKENADMSFMGVTPSGPFIVGEQIAAEWLKAPNAHGKSNSDILRPWFNGSDITGRSSNSWVVDFSAISTEQEAALFELPFAFLKKEVLEARKNYKTGGKIFWKFERPRPEMRAALSTQARYLARSMVGKHQFYVWFSAYVLPANLVIVFAHSDDYFFGILQSRFHEVWSLKQGTRLEDRPRYTPTTCFETFPFPRPTPKQEAAIAAAAQELNALRERWLNPPEWTVEKILEFPGSVNGAWARYVVKPDKNGVGTVRYPRLEPRDADCAAKLKDRTLTKLYNERPAWLDLAHKKLDAAVAAAYGFPADLTDEQILEKLLALNLERAGEEAKAAKMKIPKASRAKSDEEMI
ncbi:MAG TPA: DNA methyltransferase [Verrucomicrobiae bacterium]